MCRGHQGDGAHCAWQEQTGYQKHQFRQLLGQGVFTGGARSPATKEASGPPVDWSGLCTHTCPAKLSENSSVPLLSSCFLPSKAEASLSSPPGFLVEVTGGWARGPDWLIKTIKGKAERPRLQHKARDDRG